MSIMREASRRFAANSIFPSVFHVALGLVVTQVGVARIHCPWHFHVFLGIVGLALFGHVLFRARMHWARIDLDISSLRASVLGAYLLLFAVGAFVGLVVSSGSALLVGAGTAVTYLLPWIKIAVCRARFVVSAAVVLAGAVACVAISGRPAQPLHAIVVGWMLFVAPMFTQLLVLALLDRGYRVRETRLVAPAEFGARMQFPD